MKDDKVSMTIDALISKYREIVEESSLSYAAEWKAKHAGRKVVGCYPVYTPLEIIHAAGVNNFQRCVDGVASNYLSSRMLGLPLRCIAEGGLFHDLSILGNESIDGHTDFVVLHGSRSLSNLGLSKIYASQN